MVFARFFFGIGCGLTIPFIVHDNVYYAIASCLLAPHLKFREQQSKLSQNLAYKVEHLDFYLKDVGKSFLFFWLIIGPTLYLTYYKGENILEMAENDARDGGFALNDKNNPARLHDNFADIITKIKNAEYRKKNPQKQQNQPAAQVKDKGEAASEAAKTPRPEEGPVITFQDYEALMKKLEKEQNWDAIEQANPKAAAYQRRNVQEELRQKMYEQEARISTKL